MLRVDCYAFVTVRSWSIFLLLALFAIIVVSAFGTGGGFRDSFCDAFSQINEVPKAKDLCGFFERRGICRLRETEGQFKCEVNLSF